VLDAFVRGSGQTNYNELRNYLQLTDTLSWSHGKHLVKVGINLPELSRWSLNDRTNFDGTFQFSSLEDYLQGRPFSFVQQQGTSQLVYCRKRWVFFAQDEMRVRPGLSIAFGLRYDWQNYISNPRTLLRESPSPSLRGDPGRSYFAVAQESSTRPLDRRRSLTCFASMVKPYARRSSRIRVIQTHSRPGCAPDPSKQHCPLCT